MEEKRVKREKGEGRDPLHLDPKKIPVPVYDWVLVAVESKMYNKIKGETIEIHLDPSYRKHHNARLDGVVISSCQKRKDERMYEVDPGSPYPQIYRGHEYLQTIKNHSFETPDSLLKAKYNSSPFEPNYFTATHGHMKLNTGDTVYFHYLSLKEENYVGRTENLLLYFIEHKNIFGIVLNSGKGSIGFNMINNFAFVEPFYGFEFKEIDVDDRIIRGRTRKITNHLGEDVEIVTQTNEKKEYLHGVLKFIGFPLGPRGIESQGPDAELTTWPVNDVVIFTPSSEFENDIEGVPMYTMRHTDIMAKVTRELVPFDEEDRELFKQYGEAFDLEQWDNHDNFMDSYWETDTGELQKWRKRVVPVADWVLIHPEGVMDSKLILAEKYKKKATKGRVVRMGKNIAKFAKCEIEPGDVVEFDNRDPQSCIYLKEYNKVLVRYGFIYFKHPKTRNDYVLDDTDKDGIHLV